MRFRIHNYFFPGRIFKYRRLMQAAPAWSPDRLTAWSLEQRRTLALHAYEQVPHYRRVFNEVGIHPEHCDRPEVWERLPTLNKLTLQQNAHMLLAGGARSEIGVLGAYLGIDRASAQRVAGL